MLPNIRFEVLESEVEPTWKFSNPHVAKGKCLRRDDMRLRRNQMKLRRK